MEGFEITEEQLKQNITREQLTWPVNIVEIAWKMNDSIEMNEKEFRDMLDNLFDLSNPEKTEVINIVRWKDHTTKTSQMFNNFFK